MNDNKNEEFNFNSFSGLPFYRKVNSRLLDLAKISDSRKIVDLGCGDGGITEMILAKVKDASKVVVFAVDSSSSAISLALKRFSDRKDVIINYIQSEAQNLHENIKEKVDTVIYCNSIHYVLEKEKVLRLIGNRLNEGGLLAFNTSFFLGAHPKETEAFLRKWMMKSLRVLKNEYNMKPNKDKVQSRVQLTPENYEEIVNNSGFEIKEKKIWNVQVPLDGWYEISSFKDWIEGVLPGIPLDIGKTVLQSTVKSLFKELNLTSLDRRWLSIVASKS
ncbi:MAG: hypothetical protein CL506_00470 [Actinobacteria bacterium]|nr:hypothetical protein [Actinomycetota bacterium]